MTHIADLFPDTKPPRRPRRVMAHAIDTGCGPGTTKLGHMVCSKCGWDGDWWQLDTVRELNRGIPCERCNGALTRSVEMSGA